MGDRRSPRATSQLTLALRYPPYENGREMSSGLGLPNYGAPLDLPDTRANRT